MRVGTWSLGGCASGRSRPEAPRAMSGPCRAATSDGVCDHSVSLVGSRGAIVTQIGGGRRGGEAPAGRHAQDSWSRTSRPVTGIIPPQNTMDSITEITSIGRICLGLGHRRHRQPQHAATGRGGGQGQVQLDGRVAQHDRAAGGYTLAGHDDRGQDRGLRWPRSRVHDDLGPQIAEADRPAACSRRKMARLRPGRGWSARRP